MSIFKSWLNEIIEDTLREYKRFRNIDENKAREEIINSIKYYKGDLQLRDKLVVNQSLENKWYESLKNGKPDYSIYGDDYYFCDMVACWWIYSKNYLMKIWKKGIVKDIGSSKIIIDVGNGLGFTTGALKELFPEARVIGVNLRNTLQYQYATDYGRKTGFTMIGDIAEINGQADMVFASEYFEHIQKPIHDLRRIIQYANPRTFIIANSFGSRSIGHFNYYYDGENAPVNNKKIAKLFSAELRKLGYTKIKTGLWNDRPAYWKKT